GRPDSHRWSPSATASRRGRVTGRSLHISVHWLHRLRRMPERAYISARPDVLLSARADATLVVDCHRLAGGWRDYGRAGGGRDGGPGQTARLGRGLPHDRGGLADL